MLVLDGFWQSLLRPKSTNFTTSGCPGLKGLANKMLWGLKSFRIPVCKANISEVSSLAVFSVELLMFFWFFFVQSPLPSKVTISAFFKGKAWFALEAVGAYPLSPSYIPIGPDAPHPRHDCVATLQPSARRVHGLPSPRGGLHGKIVEVHYG